MNRFLRSFKYASEGIWHAITTQRNMKIHVAVALLVIILGAIVSLTRLEWLIIIITITLVICLELVNTAIEATIDLVSKEYKPLAKIAKDTAAGAVLLMAIASVIIGIIIFAPKLF